MFLPVFVALCAAQNQPNKCKSYAIVILKFNELQKAIHIKLSIILVRFTLCDSYGLAPIANIPFFWILKKMSSLQKWPVLDAVSLYGVAFDNNKIMIRLWYDICN